MIGRGPLVTVIIPTKNSATTIEACIRSVESSTYKSVEVLVIDAESLDTTPRVAAMAGARVISSACTRTEARNKGLAMARGEYVLHLDSDMEIDERTIEECVIKGSDFDALIVPERSAGTGFWSHCRELEKESYVGVVGIEAPRFFRKTALGELGGHDETMTMGEDWDLSLRAQDKGLRIGRTKSMITHHEGELSLRSAVRKKYEYGLTALRYRTAHPREFARQTSLRGRLRLLGPRLRPLVRQPSLLVGLAVLKGFEYSAFRIAFLKSISANQS
jgi:glycosyltransferase involved in cell wall biosynthesis